MKVCDITTDTLDRMAQSVRYYLSYINSVTVLTRLIEESTIRYPISEYVERNINVSEVEIEHTFEDFSSKKADFVFKIDESKKYAFEFKYVKGPSKPEQKAKFLLNFQLYYNDLVRLAYLNRNHKYRSFFLIAGDAYDFSTYLMRDGIIEPKKNHKYNDESRSPKGRFSDFLLSFETSGSELVKFFDASQLYYLKGTPKEILNTFNGHKGNQISLYKKFKENFKDVKNIFPDEYYGIETELVSLCNDRNSGLSQSVGIWEVKYKNK